MIFVAQHVKDQYLACRKHEKLKKVCSFSISCLLDYNLPLHKRHQPRAHVLQQSSQLCTDHFYSAIHNVYYTGLFYSVQLCVCLWYLSWDFCCRNQSIVKLNRLGQSSSLHSAQCYAEFEICQAMKSIVYSTLYSAVYSALYREFDMCQPYSTI